MKACHSPSYARDAADTHARAKLFQHSVGRYHRQGGARHVGHLWHKRASDALAACAFERGDLQVGVLVIGGDAGIADFHAVIFGLDYRTRKPLFLWTFVFVRKSILCATGHHGCHTRFLAQSGCGGEGSKSSASRLRRPVCRQPRAQSLLIVSWNTIPAVMRLGVAMWLSSKLKTILGRSILPEYGSFLG